jgi:hypothetical protein
VTALSDSWGGVAHYCERKRTYRSRQFAKRAMYRMQAKLQEKMKVYRCPNCRYWHVGHKERKTDV